MRSGVLDDPADPDSQRRGRPHPSDPIDALTRLADLRDRGVLTDEEFEAQKARLLGS